MKTFIHRILAIPGFGPIRRWLYAVVTAASSASRLPTQLSMRRFVSFPDRLRSITTWNKTNLIHAAEKSGSITLREAVFRLLVRRNNYVSAMRVIDMGPRGEYSIATQLEALRAGYSAVSGEASDIWLSDFIEKRGFGVAELPARQFAAVCDAIRYSSFAFERKIDMLESIRKPNLSGSRLVMWLGVDVDVRRRAGLEADVSRLVDEILSVTSVSDADVDRLRAFWSVGREAVTRSKTTEFMKRALVSKNVTVRNVPFLLRELSDNDILEVVSEDVLFRRLSDFPQILNVRTYTPQSQLAHSMVERGVKHWFGRKRFGRPSLFVRSNADIRNQIIGILSRSDRWHLIPSARDIGTVSDTLLEIRWAEGLRHLLADDHSQAEAIFESILREDPDHKLSWIGLQWASVRATGDMSAIETLRAEIGRGKSSSGRAVVDQISAEEIVVTSRMWRGDFRRSPLAKVRPAWEAVAHSLGERFVDYDRTLTPDLSRDLLVIPLNGVSDEIRDAYHYGELVSQFRSVTAVCDPRFTKLMERSFPKIRFIPFSRRDKPLHIDDRRDDPIRDVPSVLANFVPHALHDLVCAESTIVTPARNLSTQRLLRGEYNMRSGGYLAVNHRARNARPRVGVLWRSHVTSGFRGLMYLSLDEISPLFGVQGVDFVSLQHMASEGELRTLKAHNVDIPLIDLFNDFGGTAELCASLDVVIGISTLPTEIAAAVGTPVWLLGFSPENLFLRTLGGARSADVLTANSTIIGPPLGAFTGSRASAVEATIAQTIDRLNQLALDDKGTSTEL